VKLAVKPVSARLAGTFVASHGAVDARELLLVSLSDGEGVIGHGEAAPLPSYDGATAADVADALERCRTALEHSSPHDEPSAVLDRCAELTALPQALAAIDLALWDLKGRRARAPVWRLLGAEPPEPVKVNWTITAQDRAGAAREAATARQRGFDTVKVKVAIGDDPGRLAAVRACTGPAMAIRIDANGGWSPGEAEASLRHLAPVGIELCEEPVAGVGAIAALAARTGIPLALDESAEDPAALEGRACDLLCLKISRCRGITGTVEIARRARTAGYEIYLASTLDGPLGIAAALHAAAALQPGRACGLATLALFADRPDPLPAGQGTIALASGAGLGDGLLDWYAAP
jgi:L-alanine-DL-glutamate epimerase-like enolase superfamily enzyme